MLSGPGQQISGVPSVCDSLLPGILPCELYSYLGSQDHCLVELVYLMLAIFQLAYDFHVRLGSSFDSLCSELPCPLYSSLFDKILKL